MNEMLDSIRTRTQGLRGNIVYGVMKTLTPNLHKEIVDNHNFWYRTPRPFTAFLRRQHSLKRLVGAEIGFGYGDNAESILKTLNIEKLYCVDPMQPYTNIFNIPVEDYFKPELNKYAQVSSDPRVRFVKVTSDRAFNSELLPYKKLDFVYVDGYHSYEQTYRDIINGLNYVKVGGYVGGHDFTRQFEKSVVKAVLKATDTTGFIPEVEMPDYWFRKENGAYNLTKEVS